MKRYPDPWNLNAYARMACMARGYPTARKVLVRVKDDVEQEIWRSRTAYLRCKDAAGLMNGVR